MRSRLIMAAFLIAATTFAVTAFSSAARADEWCGYTTKDNAVIECGYTTAQGCEAAVGKGGMCFVDPDSAFNVKHVSPAFVSKASTRRS
jgi:hypothetical protein